MILACPSPRPVPLVSDVDPPLPPAKNARNCNGFQGFWGGYGALASWRARTARRALPCVLWARKVACRMNLFILHAPFSDRLSCCLLARKHKVL